MIKIIIALIIIIVTETLAFSQTPGVWEKRIVCTHCTMPENVRFADSLHGFILSDGPPNYSKSNTYRTSDRGITWSHISDTISSVNFNAAFRNLPLFYDTSGFIVSYYILGLCISKDTGRTWTLHAPPNGASFTNGFMINSSTYYALSRNFLNGSSPQVFITLDTGKTFLPVSQKYLTQKTLVTSAMYDTTSMWMTLWEHGDKRDELYHSTDKGNSWNVIYPADTNTMGKFFYKIEKGSSIEKLFLVGTGSVKGAGITIQISGQDFDFLQSTDNGTTWNGSSKNNGNISILRNPRGDEVWSVMYDQHTIGYSWNNGANWLYDSVTFKNDSIQNMIWQDSLHGYVFCYQDSTVNLYIYSTASNKVEGAYYFNGGNPFKLYPTVTNGILHLLPVKSLDGILGVYDIFGRLVLRENIKAQADQIIDFSLASFATGVYFITFSSGGNLGSSHVIKE